MKKFHVLSFLFFLILGIGNVSAQETIEKGKFTLEIKKIDSDQPEVAAMLGMMKGSKVNLSFDETKTLLDMNMMNGMMTTTTLTDKSTKKTIILMDMMGNKMMAESTEENKEEEKKPEVEVTYDKADTKKILGYNCFRADIKIKNGAQSMNMTAYVTQDIKANAELLKQQGVDASKLEGVPLEYSVETNQQGMKFSMTFQVIEILKTLAENAFELTTEGFKKVSMDELRKGAGMGF